MKSHKINIAFLLCILLVPVSCSNKSEDTKKANVLNLDLEIIESTKVFDYVKRIKLVPLEMKSDALIGGIQKIVVEGERIYILDGGRSQSVFIFDKTGKHLKTINSQGKGPGEYVSTHDMDIDPYNNELIIVDAGDRKILKYDLDGNYLSDLKLEFNTYAIGFIDDDTYAFKSLVERNPAVITTNHKGTDSHVIHTGLFEFNLMLYSHFPKFKDQQYYFEHLDDTIYKLGKRKAEPWIVNNFGNLRVTTKDKEKLKSLSMQSWGIPNPPKTKAGAIDTFLETNEMIQLFCRYKGKRTSIIVNKANKNQVSFMYHRESGPLTILLFGIGSTDESGNFVGRINPNTYLNLFQDQNFKKLLNKGFIEIEKDGFIGQTDVSINSNPIITFVEFFPPIS